MWTRRRDISRVLVVVMVFDCRGGGGIRKIIMR
jgi:hypothetical protein